MRRLSKLEAISVAGSGIEADFKVYTLGIAGITLDAQGAVSLAVGLCSQSMPLVHLGVATLAVGSSMIGSAVYAEHTGYSDLVGWYDFAQNIKYYKGLLWG